MKEIIKTFYEQNKKFWYLKKLNIAREITDSGCTGYQLELVLTEYPFFEGDSTFTIIFEGVGDIKIGKLDGLFKLAINIKDLSHDNLENIKYKVTEIEDETLSFYCNEINIK